MNTPRPIGALNGTIAGAWNLDFTTKRKANIKRLIRQRLRCHPKGKGNKAWKRVDLASRDASTLSWPDFYNGIL